MQYVLQHGNSIDVMRTMPENSVDAIVTDPPYELGFMGKSWDASGIAYNIEMWRGCLRVLKPGGHLLSFGATRTYHRMTCAIEDAGFEIRDCIDWLYGTGFPKSLNISKAIDKAAGAEREVAAKQWDGWGTALKPAHEPIVLARKPFDTTVAQNVLTHGTGALNIDGCRIATTDSLNGGAYAKDGTERHDGAENWRYKREGGAGEFQQPEGRWPANIVLDEESAELLDKQSGIQKSGVAVQRNRDGEIHNQIYGSYHKPAADDVGFGDTGGASRFFYVAKASRSEREAGCGALPQKAGGSNAKGYVDDVAKGQDRNRPVANHHPTVKPIALMRYLCRLVTPSNGIVLDPFLGSGSTGCAAVLEGFRFIGCDLSQDYVNIAQARIAHWVNSHEDVEPVVVESTTQNEVSEGLW